jgi:hypothetical protein
MNRKGPFMVGVALLLGTGLTTALPGAVQAQDWQATPKAAGTVGDEFFRVEWTVGSGKQDDSRITGYVYNTYGEAAQNVQLRISELDGSGQVVSSVFRPVFGTVPAGDRSYFDVQVPKGSSYQVNVESFDFLEEPEA